MQTNKDFWNRISRIDDLKQKICEEVLVRGNPDILVIDDFAIPR